MINDARSRYTKMRIKEAFLSLAKEKPDYKITVKEICVLAEINRATFYNHYQDVYALKEQLQEETTEHFGAFVKEHLSRSHSIEETLCMILKIIREKAEDKPILAYYVRDEMFLKRFMRYFEDELAEEISRYYPEYSEEERRILYHFAAEGTGAAISHWIKGGEKVPPERAAHIITDRIF